MLCDPPLCTYAELHNGTYSIDDLADMLEALNLKEALADSQTSEQAE